MNQYKKPLPIVDNDTKPFWDGCNKEKLLIQKCDDCQNYIFYPRIICPGCMSEHLTWQEVSGKGSIYSFTIARRPAEPAFSEDVPYIVALVDLNEGVRMMSNIVNVSLEDIHCDMEVQVFFEKASGNFKIPKFQPFKS